MVLEGWAEEENSPRLKERKGCYRTKVYQSPAD